MDFRGPHFSECTRASKVLIRHCGWGSAPDPAGEAYSAPPDPLAGFKGAYFQGVRGEGRAGKGRQGKGGDRKEGEGGKWKGKGHTGTSFCPL